MLASVSARIATGSPERKSSRRVDTSRTAGRRSSHERNRGASQVVPIASGNLHLKKPKLLAGSSKIGRRLSPECMRVVIEALREYPLLAGELPKRDFTANHLSTD